MFQWLCSLFYGSHLVVPQEKKLTSREIKNIVRAKARGNYNLQQGRFTTSSGIERLREEVLSKRAAN